jgi:hypothetical protein
MDLACGCAGSHEAGGTARWTCSSRGGTGTTLSEELVAKDAELDLVGGTGVLGVVLEAGVPVASAGLQQLDELSHRQTGIGDDLAERAAVELPVAWDRYWRSAVAA